MGSKTLSQEYELLETDDSPLKPYRPITKFRNTTSATSSVSHENKSPQKQCYNDEKSVKEVTNEKHVLEERSGAVAEKNCLKAENKQFDNVSVTKKRQVLYICSRGLVEKCNKMLKIPNRV